MQQAYNYIFFVDIRFDSVIEASVSSKVLAPKGRRLATNSADGVSKPVAMYIWLTTYQLRHHVPGDINIKKSHVPSSDATNIYTSEHQYGSCNKGG